MRELIVDNFAGGGGASTGIEMALGVSPDYAINHSSVALAMHEVNHPATVHLCNNVWKVDPDEIDGPIGLGWFSPDCKHFSKAKGGKPVEKGIRDLAWVVVRWARRRKGGPRVIILENVEEFSTWGPLAEDGRPCPDRKGLTFKRWVGELRRLGYKVEWRELRACDYGAPTIRKRLFLIARRDGEPIVWPEATHGDPKSAAVLSGMLKPWRTAAEIIDWSIPCHSIFLTPEEARTVGVKRPLAPATMARIAKGVKRYVIDAARPYIVNLTHQGGDRVESLDEPLATITGAHRGEKALAMPFVTAAQQGGSLRSLDEPIHTITASTKDQNQVAVPFVTGVGGRMGQTAPRGADQPVQTITAKADSVVISPHLMTMRDAQKPFNEADKPTHTITAGGARLHLVAAFLAQHNVSRGEQNPGRDAREPVSTILQTGSHQGIVAANMVRQFGTGVGSPMDEPARTVMADGGGKTQLSAAFLSKYYGPNVGQDADAPLHTATEKPRFGLVIVSIDGEPYVIADIGLRMLTPRELFRAQGFPESYVIDRKPDGSPISKTEQVSKCGNSVSPPMAAALVKANFAPRDVAFDGDRGSYFLEAAE
ncbi:DNA methyltransferase [Afipia sp. P52-10]|uniref:DNA cytosine methyltransferase n=1 Tax=Afipia sp. P52-10 TaxID=1429916 RepID=UPI0003DF119F|nr:DNA cytosine methyltransferase [Afipia sp. P52-10]ETR75058.1 DNA methyltransferase [Afipia sp. P52-10]